MEKVSVLILAGGRSTRMGRDKAWLEWEGQPLIEHVLGQLMVLADEVLVSTNDADSYARIEEGWPVPVRLVADQYPGAGPLAGLHAGLTAARNELLFAVATDMPFVNRRLAYEVLNQCSGVDAALPRLIVAGQDQPQPEPLFAAYRKTCLPAIEVALTAGRRRAVSFLADVKVRYVNEDVLRRWDPELKSFRNVNTPADWASATGHDLSVP